MNEMNIAVDRAGEAYEKMQFRAALKYGCFDLMAARDIYRFSCKAIPMNRSLVERYLVISTLLLVPIAPHTMDHIWVHLLKKEHTALTAGWPHADAPSYGLKQAGAFVEDFVVAQRRSKAKLEAPAKKKGQPSGERKKFTQATVSTGNKYLPWQEIILNVLTERYIPETSTFAEDVVSRVVSELQASPSGAGKDEKQIKRFAMPFTKYKMEQALRGAGLDALRSEPAFDEGEVLEELRDYIQEAVGVETLLVKRLTETEAAALDVYPGNPNVTFS